MAEGDGRKGTHTDFEKARGPSGFFFGRALGTPERSAIPFFDSEGDGRQWTRTDSEKCAGPQGGGRWARARGQRCHYSISKGDVQRWARNDLEKRAGPQGFFGGRYGWLRGQRLNFPIL